ncbi:HutD family protein [Ancylobacter dichloromethanicus]|uniref:Histidine utilization protein HutD n=1 Tax=Ancylobacter dichloromethanicus TaxID=518825 RepID=A0A9W6N172_9HYPH|nr:HutD family protein [Ancylobacter dichloromethanicus]MBS7552169.1 HutD family protein [Ancylobacter dichloromethanicus]GLK73903.1 histidine utilization protein HutD [Ancylobacter dichloromethanicus]
MSVLRVIRPSDYRRVPWKNGGGMTQDVLMLPEGASHEDFDVRVSLAPIVEEGRFSSFPGIDRHITRLSGNGLGLTFANGTRELNRLEPFYFDSVQQPRAALPDGPAWVINVMTRRGRWHAQVMPAAASNGPLLAAPEGGMVILHAVTGIWQVGDAAGSVLVHPGETLVASDEPTLRTSCEPTGEALIAFLAPTGPRGTPA